MTKTEGIKLTLSWKSQWQEEQQDEKDQVYVQPTRAPTWNRMSSNTKYWSSLEAVSWMSWGRDKVENRGRELMEGKSDSIFYDVPRFHCYIFLVIGFFAD